MDIKQSVEELLKEIEVKKQAAELLIDEAKRAQEGAKLQTAMAADMMEKVDKAKKELAPFEATEERVKELDDAEEQSLKDRQMNVEKHNSLVRWENSLVEIESRQKGKEIELKEKELKLNEEKVTYKEKLKKDFMLELSEKLG